MTDSERLPSIEEEKVEQLNNDDSSTLADDTEERDMHVDKETDDDEIGAESDKDGDEEMKMYVDKETDDDDIEVESDEETKNIIKTEVTWSMMEPTECPDVCHRRSSSVGAQPSCHGGYR